jgi:hypothetical protein
MLIQEMQSHIGLRSETVFVKYGVDVAYDIFVNADNYEEMTDGDFDALVVTTNQHCSDYWITFALIGYDRYILAGKNCGRVAGLDALQYAIYVNDVPDLDEFFGDFPPES